MRQIKLYSNEVWPLLNVLNEVCYGIKINNLEISIGVKKQIVVDFMDSIVEEEKKNEVILTIDDSELNFLNNSFEEVFRQIEEWEFQTRIGISIQEAQKIQEKLNL